MRECCHYSVTRFSRAAGGTFRVVRTNAAGPREMPLPFDRRELEAHFNSGTEFVETTLEKILEELDANGTVEFDGIEEQ